MSLYLHRTKRHTRESREREDGYRARRNLWKATTTRASCYLLSLLRTSIASRVIRRFKFRETRYCSLWYTRCFSLCVFTRLSRPGIICTPARERDMPWFFFLLSLLVLWFRVLMIRRIFEM